MMDIEELGRTLKSFTKENYPIILSAAAGIGTITTAYLSGRASFKAARVLDQFEELEGISDDKFERFKDRFKVVWKLYIPTAISAASTIGCIFGAGRGASRKTLAATTALTASQQLYSEYRDKVIEELGERKDQAIRDKIEEDRVKLNPPPAADVVIAGSGHVLAMESYTGRYFNSDMESLLKAQNKINAKAISQDYATMTEFYYLVGLSQTQMSSEIGWKSSRLMELMFTTALSEDDRPCLVFEYNYVTPL